MASNGTLQDVSDALLPVCLFYCGTHSAAEIQIMYVSCQQVSKFRSFNRLYNSCGWMFALVVT